MPYKFFHSLLAVACVFITLSDHVDAAPLADHVVLISVDGFRPDFYLDETWPAPIIQHMAREGVRAERVRSVFPSVTYPAHTTIVTGALPARHGIVYNEPFEPAGQTGRWYWEYSAIRVPTLWTAAREQGRKTAGVSWPVTVGAPIDWLVPEVWSLDPNSDRLAPMREGSRPAGLWEEIEREATGKLTARTYSSAWISRDTETGAAAAYILETYKPAFMALHLISTDHFMHEDGRDSAVVRRALGTVDAAVNAIVEAAQRAGVLERTAFVITGDHGFVNVHTTVAPNVWLARAGLMEAKPDRGDWRATFHTAGGAAFLRLRDPNDRTAANRVRRLIDDAPPGVRKLFRVVETKELAASGSDPASPLALAAGMGVAFSSRADGEPVSAGSGGTHGYFPSDFPEIYTGFVGWGAGFRKGLAAHEIALEDIAPLIARLLDLPLPAPDGVLHAGLLE